MFGWPNTQVQYQSRMPKCPGVTVASFSARCKSSRLLEGKKALVPSSRKVRVNFACSTETRAFPMANGRNHERAFFFTLERASENRKRFDQSVLISQGPMVPLHRSTFILPISLFLMFEISATPFEIGDVALEKCLSPPPRSRLTNLPSGCQRALFSHV